MEPPAQHDQALRNKVYVIPYMPVSHGMGFAIAGCAIGLIILSGSSVISGYFFLAHPAAIISLAMFILSFVVILGFLFFEKTLAKKVSIVVCDEGIVFPYMFKPDLLFRPSRPWSDIAHVLVGSMPEGKGTYEYELEKGISKKKLFIYFKSGGHAYIDLSRMSPKGVQLLLVAIESWCLEFSRSPKIRLNNDDNRFIDRKPNALPDLTPKSYTELWEQDMNDHFSATNFVPLRKGKLLRGGRLRILMQIASGGLSAIYLAETPEKELRLVKEATLPTTLEDSVKEKAKEMFVREATILQSLSHPKIASVLDFFVEDGRDYLVLEFVPGYTIRQMVRQSGSFKEEDVLVYSKQIADILEYLHCQEPPVVHRDVTPDNLVIREDGEVVLIDFGAANQFVGTATGTLVGKQAYIAPEQFRGKAQEASDIYALGGSMFFMLTGRDPEALSTSHPRAINPEISPGVSLLVEKCTAQEVADRIKSATELYDKASELLDNGGGAIISMHGRGHENS